MARPNPPPPRNGPAIERRTFCGFPKWRAKTNKESKKKITEEWTGKTTAKKKEKRGGGQIIFQEAFNSENFI